MRWRSSKSFERWYPLSINLAPRPGLEPGAYGITGGTLNAPEARTNP